MQICNVAFAKIGPEVPARIDTVRTPGARHRSRPAPIRQLEQPLFDGDPVAALDERIAALRTLREASPRFGDAYWAADDAIALLRMSREEVARTGRLRDEVNAALATPPLAIGVVPTLQEQSSEVAAEADAPKSRSDSRPVVAA